MACISVIAQFSAFTPIAGVYRCVNLEDVPVFGSALKRSTGSVASVADTVCHQ